MKEKDRSEVSGSIDDQKRMRTENLHPWILFADTKGKMTAPPLARRKVGKARINHHSPGREQHGNPGCLFCGKPLLLMGKTINEEGMARVCPDKRRQPDILRRHARAQDTSAARAKAR
jgi:hypothetical protein